MKTRKRRGSLSGKGRALLVGLTMMAALLADTEGRAAEELRFQVLERRESIEIRSYEPLIVAETLVEGDFEAAGEEGFRRLFYYLAGNNRIRPSGALAVPDTTVGDSLIMSLTTPVFQEKAGEKYRVYLPLPFGVRLQDLPEPVDPQVALKNQPGRIMAAAGFSGDWSQDAYQEGLERLRETVRDLDLEISGPPIFARYDPSLFWFLRRNEILLPVESLRNR